MRFADCQSVLIIYQLFQRDAIDVIDAFAHSYLIINDLRNVAFRYFASKASKASITSSYFLYK